MNRINDTTRISEINKIKQQLQISQKLLNSLIIIVNKIVKYENIKTTNIVPNNGIVEIEGNVRITGELLSANITSLCESMDLLLEQTLTTQRELLDANTITISHQLKNEDIEININEGNMTIIFNVEPTKSGQLVITINDVDLTLFIDYSHNVVYSDDSRFVPRFINHQIEINTNSQIAVSSATVKSVNLIREYEFEQDSFLTFCVQYLESKDNAFFNNLIETVQEYKK